jgi:hypothetical protein
MDNEALCAISCAYGLENGHNRPPDTPVNVIQPRAPTVPPVGAHSRGMTVAQCPGWPSPHPGKWGGRQVPASPDCRDRGWTCRSLGSIGPRSESTSPTPRPPIPRSCAAWPTAPPRRAHCPLPWTQSRIAATDKVDQAIRIGRFVDAALDLVLRLQLPALGGDKAKNDLLLVFRQDAQRLEAAGAIGVELEES